MDVDVLWVDFDVLWSPDSKYLALTGNPNGYTNYLRVFQITESGPIQLAVTGAPFADMIRRFPPCRASHADPKECEEMTKDRRYINSAAVSWADQHTLVVMSEVPCTSRWGGIMCQVMGYEIDIPSGRILRSLTAREFKKKWQHVMAWKFRIPDPPEWQN